MTINWETITVTDEYPRIPDFDLSFEDSKEWNGPSDDDLERIEVDDDDFIVDDDGPDYVIDDGDDDGTEWDADAYMN